MATSPAPERKEFCSDVGHVGLESKINWHFLSDKIADVLGVMTGKYSFSLDAKNHHLFLTEDIFQKSRAKLVLHEHSLL